MRQFNSIDEILDFAINSEQRAVNFYNYWARRTNNNEMREIFEGFAREEMQHKARLVKMKEDKIFIAKNEKVPDLKISSYTAKVKPAEEMTYSEALVLAMQREKSAFKLYTDIATQLEDSGLRAVFLSLAQEEAKHKLRFELEYDENVLREN